MHTPPHKPLVPAAGDRLVLHDRETSSNCYKVRLFLSFLALPYQRVPVRLQAGRNAVDTAYLSLNPRGQVPTLADGGVVLWGSTAILCYLARRYDESREWLPIDAAAMARVCQWLELAQNEIASGLFMARAIQRFGYTGDLAASRAAGEQALRVLEGQLERDDWLAGERATLADVACFPHVALAGQGGFQLAGYPSVGRWLARFRKLERFVPMPGVA
ncbi:MAG: glutathione S-transferase family protein [Ramlibacter sp.]|nr:glutathione S-transferase family protein [Ramlibacter sp.]